MSNIDDLMENMQNRDEMIESVRDCESALLLWYDDEGRVHVHRMGLTCSSEAYALACGTMLFHEYLGERTDSDG